jgi:hypothetical protein
VSRRLALVELLPGNVQQQVRVGEIPDEVFVPVARGSVDDCQEMAAAFARHKFTSRQAGQLYVAWRDASPQIQQRLLEQSQLFLKTQRETEPQAAGSSLQELLCDLEIIAAIAHQANRRVSRDRAEFERMDGEQRPLSSEHAQSASFQLGPGAGAPACGEGRTLSATDPGVVLPAERRILCESQLVASGALLQFSTRLAQLYSKS